MIKNTSATSCIACCRRKSQVAQPSAPVWNPGGPRREQIYLELRIEEGDYELL